jgi:hypothetical protein
MNSQKIEMVAKWYYTTYESLTVSKSNDFDLFYDELSEEYKEIFDNTLDNLMGFSNLESIQIWKRFIKSCNQYVGITIIPDLLIELIYK